MTARTSNSQENCVGHEDLLALDLEVLDLAVAVRCLRRDRYGDLRREQSPVAVSGIASEPPVVMSGIASEPTVIVLSIASEVPVVVLRIASAHGGRYLPESVLGLSRSKRCSERSSTRRTPAEGRVAAGYEFAGGNIERREARGARRADRRERVHRRTSCAARTVHRRTSCSARTTRRLTPCSQRAPQLRLQLMWQQPRRSLREQPRAAQAEDARDSTQSLSLSASR